MNGKQFCVMWLLGCDVDPVIAWIRLIMTYTCCAMHSEYCYFVNVPRSCGQFIGWGGEGGKGVRWLLHLTPDATVCDDLNGVSS